jgi:hypothetical protein
MSISERSIRDDRHRNQPLFIQHRLKRLVDPHGHGSLRPSFSNQLLIAVDYPVAALHRSLRREAVPPLAHDLKSKFRRKRRPSRSRTGVGRYVGQCVFRCWFVEFPLSCSLLSEARHTGSPGAANLMRPNKTPGGFTERNNGSWPVALASVFRGHKPVVAPTNTLYLATRTGRKHNPGLDSVLQTLRKHS